MTTKKKVLENSFLYSFSSILVKAIGFFLLPLYTFYLSTEDYGIINLITPFISIVSIIVSMGLVASLIRYYSIYKDNHERLRRFYSSIINFVFLSTTIVFFIMFIGRSLISSLFLGGVDSVSVFIIILLLMAFTTFQSIHQGILQGLQQGRKLTTINIISFLIIVLLKIVFIVVLKMGITGFLLAQLIVNISYFVYMMYDVLKMKLYKIEINRDDLNEALKYSFPLIPHSLSTLIASFISRLIIGASTTLGMIGIYSIAMQFSAIVDLIQISFHKAIKPWFFETAEKGTIKDINEIKSITYLLLYMYTILYIGVSLFSQEVVILITSSEYWMSWTIIPILMIGFSVKSIYYFYVNNIIFDVKGTRYLFIASVTGNLADVILAVILIPILGIYGAAIAFVIAKIILTAIVVIISKKYTVVDFNILKMIRIITVGLIFTFIGLYFSYTSAILQLDISNFIYKIVIFACYLSLIAIINRKIIIKSINTIKNRV